MWQVARTVQSKTPGACLGTSVQMFIVLVDERALWKNMVVIFNFSESASHLWKILWSKRNIWITLVGWFLKTSDWGESLLSTNLWHLDNSLLLTVNPNFEWNSSNVRVPLSTLIIVDSIWSLQIQYASIIYHEVKARWLRDTSHDWCYCFLNKFLLQTLILCSFITTPMIHISK